MALSLRHTIVALSCLTLSVRALPYSIVDVDGGDSPAAQAVAPDTVYITKTQADPAPVTVTFDPISVVPDNAEPTTVIVTASIVTTEESVTSTTTTITSSVPPVVTVVQTIPVQPVPVYTSQAPLPTISSQAPAEPATSQESTDASASTIVVPSSIPIATTSQAPTTTHPSPVFPTLTPYLNSTISTTTKVSSTTSCSTASTTSATNTASSTISFSNTTTISPTTALSSSTITSIPASSTTSIITYNNGMWQKSDGFDDGSYKTYYPPWSAAVVSTTSTAVPTTFATAIASSSVTTSVASSSAYPTLYPSISVVSWNLTSRH
ncbi:hypothetical protein ANO11243_043030 [Dothideomycetidae sp. 11243]|nr:hypothetical protein ANO11243_043030 [fungal sp. No.11243]